MQLSLFDFNLPKELIARFPLEKRTDSRLMRVQSEMQSISHHHFGDVVDFLESDDLLVFNDTKVIAARLTGKKKTGGRVELLVERILSTNRFIGQLHVSKPPKINDEIFFDNNVVCRIIAKKDRFYEFEYLPGIYSSILAAVEAIGAVPLPPYMERQPRDFDKQRYQTIYAKTQGSVAAPTAGLHFDEQLMQKIRQKGVQIGMLTLHIGAGTFLPVRCENITEHKMHTEYFELTPTLCQQITAAKTANKRIIAVGTTSARALETVAQADKIIPCQTETNIFIYPGFEFRCIDALITNFHLPCSSLLMLVTAFAGYDLVMRAYQEAIANQYRFYSYGDAMWLNKADSGLTQTIKSL